jgi:hypothetical protein
MRVAAQNLRGGKNVLEADGEGGGGCRHPSGSA